MGSTPRGDYKQARLGPEWDSATVELQSQMQAARLMAMGVSDVGFLRGRASAVAGFGFEWGDLHRPGHGARLSVVLAQSLPGDSAPAPGRCKLRVSLSSMIVKIVIAVVLSLAVQSATQAQPSQIAVANRLTDTLKTFDKATGDLCESFRVAAKAVKQWQTEDPAFLDKIDTMEFPQMQHQWNMRELTECRGSLEYSADFGCEVLAKPRAGIPLRTLARMSIYSRNHCTSTQTQLFAFTIGSKLRGDSLSFNVETLFLKAEWYAQRAVDGLCPLAAKKPFGLPHLRGDD